MSNVLVVMGDIFEGAAQVTVLPCSGKGSVSSTVRRWLTIFDIPAPKDIPSQPQLGEISELIPFKGETRITQHIVFAASVLNDYSSFEIIHRIAARLGQITQLESEIRFIETPLLGTGAGGLKTEVAGKALHQGFKSTAHPDSTLSIFVSDKDRHTKLQALLSSPEVAAVQSGHDHNSKVRLAQFLEDYFGKEDLENLCYDLGIDYDNLQGEKKGTKARNLVKFMETQGRIEELHSKLADERSTLYKQTFG